MGLDIVELVMEIEEAFSITIPDEEAARMVTVGDVFDYIVARTSIPRDNSICLTAVTFYSLRRAATTLGAPQRLRPHDSTLAILPDHNRQKFWSRLQTLSELHLPSLRRPNWLITICTVLVIISSVLIGMFVFHFADSLFVGFASASASGFVLAVVIRGITRPLAIYPASSCVTLRGLAESALAINFATLSEQYQGAGDKDLWVTLRSIVVEQLGVSPDEVTRSASFVNDLGCD